PTTAPAHSSEPKGISGDYLCQQRVTGAHQTMASESPDSSATYHHTQTHHHTQTYDHTDSPILHRVLIHQ
ncbi:MAG: hypothetical protein WCF45_09140, partial [Photobacterium halotolerans]